MTLKNTLRWKVKNVISNNYLGFKYITRKISKRSNMIVSKNSDIVIEGYPRSANTFAVAGIKLAQNDQINIASHRHEIGHIRYALQLHKPVIVLIRNPIDAIVSFIIREDVSISFSINYYIYYYKKVNKYKNRVLILKFDEIIDHLDKSIDKINKKFNLYLSLIKINNTTNNKILGMVASMHKAEQELIGKGGNNNIRSIAVPSLERENVKRVIVNKIQTSPNLKKKINNANSVYNQVID